MSAKKKVTADVPPATSALTFPSDLTFQKHPLLQIKEETPDSDDLLEILLRPDGVRFMIYSDDGRVISVHISPADFGAFVECGHAHHFQTSAPGDWTFRENPLLQIMSEQRDGNSYLEILLRPDGASFEISARDHEGLFHARHVRVSPANFKTLIERCHTHRFTTEAS
jgi:hypothetical protein